MTETISGAIRQTSPAARPATSEPTSVRVLRPAAPPLLQDVLVSDAALPWLHLPNGAGMPRAQAVAAVPGEYNMVLCDPLGGQADPVIEALASATGQPVQQLRLRSRSDLQTLAVVSRATVAPASGLVEFERLPPQRLPLVAQPLPARCVHVLAPGPLQPDPADPVADALAASADLLVVFALPDGPGGADDVLRARCLASAGRPTWQCPMLVVVLPERATAAQQRAWTDAPWPEGLQRRLLTRPADPSPLTLWHQIVVLWQQMAAARRPGEALPTDAVIDAAAPALARLARLDGMEACALLNLDDAGLILVDRHPTRGEAPATERLAALAQAMCSARRTHALLVGGPASPDEWLVTTGPQQCLLRRLPGTRPWGFLAVANRTRVNLALLRCCLQDLERLFN